MFFPLYIRVFRAFSGLFLYASPDAYKCIHAYKKGRETIRYRKTPGPCPSGPAPHVTHTCAHDRKPVRPSRHHGPGHPRARGRGVPRPRRQPARAAQEPDGRGRRMQHHPPHGRRPHDRRGRHPHAAEPRAEGRGEHMDMDRSERPHAHVGDPHDQRDRVPRPRPARPARPAGARQGHPLPARPARPHRRTRAQPMGAHRTRAHRLRRLQGQGRPIGRGRRMGQGLAPPRRTDHTPRMQLRVHGRGDPLRTRPHVRRVDAHRDPIRRHPLMDRRERPRMPGTGFPEGHAPGDDAEPGRRAHDLHGGDRMHVRTGHGARGRGRMDPRPVDRP